MAIGRKILFLYNENLDKIDLNELPVHRIFLTKVSHIYSVRNEWTDWRGSTDVVERNHTYYFYLNLQDAKKSVERQRGPGTRFGIQETPAFCAASNDYCLILSNPFTPKPSFNELENIFLKKDLTLKSLLDCFKASYVPYKDFRACGLFTGQPKEISHVSKNEVFYKLRGTVAGSKNGLAWSYKPQEIDLTSLERNIIRFTGHVE